MYACSNKILLVTLLSYIFHINQKEEMLQIIWLDTNELLKDPHPPKGQKDPHPPT